MIEDLDTERLSIRPLRATDGALLMQLDGDAEVMRFITGKAATRAQIEAELTDILGTRWLVFDAADTFLGWVGAVPNQARTEFDVGWRFRVAAWGNGYATEAAAALVDALFSEGAERVFAQTMAVNRPSRAVMERIGLSYCRTFHLDFDDPLPGTELGEVEYDVSRTTWLAR